MLTMTGILYSPAWPRWRRLARTGSENPNYVNGRFTRYRRHRLEAPLQHAMRQLYPPTVLKILPRLPSAARAEATELLGWLTGTSHPDTWALRDTRKGRAPAWYVPRAAWRFCGAWLRQARAVVRLLALTPSVIRSTMPPLLKRGPREQQQTVRRTIAGELERLRAWSTAHGIAWEPRRE